MFNRFNVIFNNTIDKDLGIKCVKRPNIPSPTRQYIEREIPGRDGKLYEDLGTYDDIEIDIQYNFVSNDWNETFRGVKSWINNIKDRKLIFTDDANYFYIVKKANIESSERVIKRIGRFTIKFICKPFMFLEEGLNPVTVNNSLTIYNYGCISQPEYKITGNGNCTLTVNGETMVANIGGNLTINTELMLAYRQDGTMQNTAVTGDYKDLYLQEGSNTISITNGFILNVIPNWRGL